GVTAASGVLNTLLDRRLVKIVGRKQVVGRPFMYGTTREFLDKFGLKDLSDLPKVEDMSEALGFDLPTPVDEEGTLPLDFGGEHAGTAEGTEDLEGQRDHAEDAGGAEDLEGQLDHAEGAESAESAESEEHADGDAAADAEDAGET